MSENLIKKLLKDKRIDFYLAYFEHEIRLLTRNYAAAAAG